MLSTLKVLVFLGESARRYLAKLTGESEKKCRGYFFGEKVVVS